MGRTPRGVLPISSVLDGDGAYGTAVPCLGGGGLHLRRDFSVGIRFAGIAYPEYLRADALADAAADAGIVESCFHALMDKLQSGAETVKETYLLSFSAGYSRWQDWGGNLQNFLTEADRQMYRNKEAKRS